MPLCEGLPCSAQSCATSSPASANRASISGIGRVSPVQTTLPGRRRPNAVSGQVMAHREHLEPRPVMPERRASPGSAGTRPTSWRRPRPTRPDTRPGATAGAARSRRARTAAPCRVVPGRNRPGDEQALEAGDMVHVHMGDEQRHRRLRRSALEVGGQGLLPAVDHQPRRVIAFDHRRGRAQLHGLANCRRPGNAAPSSCRHLHADGRMRSTLHALADHVLRKRPCASLRSERSQAIEHGLAPGPGPPGCACGPGRNRSARRPAWLSTQDIVRVEVGMIQRRHGGSARCRRPRLAQGAAAPASRMHARVKRTPGSRSTRMAARVGQQAAPITGGDRRRHRQAFGRLQRPAARRNSARLRTRSSPCQR